jgi:thiol-disulfide isomerase/thioredoxin
MRFLVFMLMWMMFSIPSFGQSLKGKQQAPGFALKSLSNKTVRLSEYNGKVVLLNFWATWCVPCKAEMPEMVRWQAQYKKQGLEIIGITYPPYKAENIRRLVKKLGVNYPIVFADRKIARAYSVGEILPITIVIDRQGNIIDRILGIMDTEEFEQKVKPLLE